MRTKDTLPKKLEKAISRIMGKYLNSSDFQVFFFGSRIAGSGSERSDIDIGIEGKKPVEDKILRQIKEELENLPTLYKIEVVDFALVSDDFKKVAKSCIKKIKLG